MLLTAHQVLTKYVKSSRGKKRLSCFVAPDSRCRRCCHVPIFQRETGACRGKRAVVYVTQIGVGSAALKSQPASFMRLGRQR